VKFIFPNEENVYLHGTPAKGLFARQRRDFSHGCIRVEDPVALAEYVLRSVPGWSRDRIEDAMARGGTSQVDLPETIPVSVVYMTAVAAPGGAVGFFEDLYGHDAALERLLAGGPPYAPSEG
jgi:murein L,D-transpeptidase YcbB/YkuD